MRREFSRNTVFLVIWESSKFILGGLKKFDKIFRIFVKIQPRENPRSTPTENDAVSCNHNKSFSSVTYKHNLSLSNIYSLEKTSKDTAACPAMPLKSFIFHSLFTKSMREKNVFLLFLLKSNERSND